MIVFLIDYKPCFAVPNGFKQIDEQIYYMMLENAEIDRMEVITYD